MEIVSVSQFKPSDDVPSIKIYRGKRLNFNYETGNRGTCGVTVDNEPLKNCNDDYWEWGFGWGKRITNLSQSILTDYFRTDDIDQELVRRFRKDFIAKLPFEEWEIEEFRIDEWLDRIEFEKQREKRDQENIKSNSAVKKSTN